MIKGKWEDFFLYFGSLQLRDIDSETAVKSGPRVSLFPSVVPGADFPRGLDKAALAAARRRLSTGRCWSRSARAAALAPSQCLLQRSLSRPCARAREKAGAAGSASGRRRRLASPTWRPHLDRAHLITATPRHRAGLAAPSRPRSSVRPGPGPERAPS